MTDKCFTPCWCGECFLTSPNIGWVTKLSGHRLINVAVKPPKENAESPVTSLYKTKVSERTYAKRLRTQLKGLISQSNTAVIGNLE